MRKANKIRAKEREKAEVMRVKLLRERKNRVRVGRRVRRKKTREFKFKKRFKVRDAIFF